MHTNDRGIVLSGVLCWPIRELYLWNQNTAVSPEFSLSQVEAGSVGLLEPETVAWWRCRSPQHVRNAGSCETGASRKLLEPWNTEAEEFMALPDIYQTFDEDNRLRRLGVCYSELSCV
jgi:hypothetical protein